MGTSPRVGTQVHVRADMSDKSPVCMIKAKSPGLENAFICLFSRGAVSDIFASLMG